MLQLYIDLALSRLARHAIQPIQLYSYTAIHAIQHTALYSVPQVSLNRVGFVESAVWPSGVAPAVEQARRRAGRAHATRARGHTTLERARVRRIPQRYTALDTC